MNDPSGTPIDSSKNQTSYGKVSLIAGVFQILFNTLGIIGICILLVNIVAFVRARKQDAHQQKLAKIGVALAIIAIVGGFLGVPGAGNIFQYLWNNDTAGKLPQ